MARMVKHVQHRARKKVVRNDVSTETGLSPMGIAVLEVLKARSSHSVFSISAVALTNKFIADEIRTKAGEASPNRVQQELDALEKAGFAESTPSSHRNIGNHRTYGITESGGNKLAETLSAKTNNTDEKEQSSAIKPPLPGPS